MKYIDIPDIPIILSQTPKTHLASKHPQAGILANLQRTAFVFSWLVNIPSGYQKSVLN